MQSKKAAGSKALLLFLMPEFCMGSPRRYAPRDDFFECPCEELFFEAIPKSVNLKGCLFFLFMQNSDINYSPLPAGED
jgi:hypothetical protein